MSNEDKEKAIAQNQAELPPQKSATDTSNWDKKVSTDPSGTKYIRSDNQA